MLSLLTYIILLTLRACCACFVLFSPLSSSPNLLALGAKDSGASGFDDYGGELEILNLDFKEPGLECPAAGKVRSSDINCGYFVSSCCCWLE
jgi:hypothetical protein